MVMLLRSRGKITRRKRGMAIGGESSTRSVVAVTLGSPGVSVTVYVRTTKASPSILYSVPFAGFLYRSTYSLSSMLKPESVSAGESSGNAPVHEFRMCSKLIFDIKDNVGVYTLYILTGV